MIKYIIGILVILCAFPLGSAGLSDTGESIIANGIERSLINLGDACFDMSMGMQGENATSENIRNISTAVFYISTFTLNPYELKPVQDKQIETGLFFVFIGILLILVYGIQALVAYFKPQMAQSVNYIVGQSQTSPIQELVSKIGIIFVVMLFFDFAMMIVLAINGAYCSLVMVDVLNHIVVTPTNALFYLCFGIMYLCMTLFYIYRSLIICIIAAYGLLIGALYLIECTRWIATTILGYFVIMVFMQSIITAVCGLCIPLIEMGFSLVDGTVLGIGGAQIMYLISYFVLLAIICVIGWACVLSPFVLMIVSILFRKTLYKII